MTSRVPKLRLFVAVEIPPMVRETVRASMAELYRGGPVLRWTDPESWHFTLAFLGWVEPEQVAAAEEATSVAAAGAAPFRVSFDGTAGTFGKRVLWAGFDDSAELETLASTLQHALSERGFELEDRDFHAHLTLARAPRGGRVPRDLAKSWTGATPSWTVERLVLMRSQPRRTGAIYTVHTACPLTARPRASRR